VGEAVGPEDRPEHEVANISMPTSTVLTTPGGVL